MENPPLRVLQAWVLVSTFTKWVTPPLSIVFRPYIRCFKGHDLPCIFSWARISDMISGSTSPFLRARRMGYAGALMDFSGKPTGQHSACTALSWAPLRSPDASFRQPSPGSAICFHGNLPTRLVDSFRVALRLAMRGGCCWEAAKLFSALESSFPIIYQSQRLIRLFSLSTIADCWVLLSRN